MASTCRSKCDEFLKPAVYKSETLTGKRKGGGGGSKVFTKVAKTREKCATIKQKNFIFEKTLKHNTFLNNIFRATWLGYVNFLLFLTLKIIFVDQGIRSCFFGRTGMESPILSMYS